MDCPECGAWGFKVTCQKCKFSTAKAEKGKYPTITGRTDTTVLRDCEYLTGTWRCQWRQWASDKDEQVYCDFHRKVLETMRRHGPEYGTGQHLWDAFSDEWAFNHDSRQRHRYSWAEHGPDGTIPQTPFWYLPIQESWRKLTGLPLPENYKSLWDQGGVEKESPPDPATWQEDDPILAGKTDFEKGHLIGAELRRKIQAGERIRPLKGLTFTEWCQPGDPQPEAGGFRKL
jgi:hypothetical protein